MRGDEYRDAATEENTLRRRYAALIPAAAAALGMTLAACGVNYATDPRNPNVGGIATVSPTRPLSFYADQYLRIRGTCTADQQQLAVLIAQKPLPAPEIAAQAAKTRVACQVADTAQLKATWPSLVFTATLNQANADMVVKQPFANEAAIEAYVASAKAHTDAVLATLDLPSQR